MHFGEWVRQERVRRHLSQEALAEALGVSARSINRWEQERAVPQARVRLLLDRFFGAIPKDLLDELQEPPHSAPLWVLPFPRNPVFTGREDLLQVLHTCLIASQAIALTGLGGIGKTQMAIEYAYRFAQDYAAIFWLAAETPESLMTSLHQVAIRLDLPEQQAEEQTRMVAAVQRWLATHSQWLLIWDNLENLDLPLYYLSSNPQGRHLFTTHRRALGTLAQGIELSTMTEEEGMLLLLRRSKVLLPAMSSEPVSHLRQMPEVEAAARRLVRAMDGLPLALDQAGAYIEETSCRLEDYWHLYQTKRAALLTLRGDAVLDHPASVMATWSLAFEQVEQTSTAAADLLRLCAFLHPDAIPEELFSEGAAFLGERLGPVGTDLVQLHGVFRIVSGYSLVKRHVEERTVSIHRLVQIVLWEQMGEQEREVWHWRAIRAVNAVFPQIMPETWPQCERLLPHLLTCVATISDEAAHQDLADLLCKAADYLRGRARFAQAEPLYQRALRLEEHLVERVPVRLVASLYGLALLYYEQGKYALAAPLAEQALDMWEHASDPEDLELARLLIGLAIIVFAQGKYPQAEALLQRALQIRELALGQEHHLVVTPVTDLAEVYNEQRRDALAEVYYQRALRIQEQTRGAEHPLMAYPLYGLGRLYTKQGKDEQAETLYRQTLQIREQMLGVEHPYVAEPLTGLARCACRRGAYVQAEMLYQRALDLCEQALGTAHPETSIPLAYLAELYAAQEKDEQAEAMYQQALDIREQTLGTEHPLVATALHGLANLYKRQGRYEQAESFFRRALAMREQCLGQHPDTAETLYDLALFYKQQGNVSGACALAARAFQIRSQFLGEIHPQTVASSALYAQLIQQL